MLSLLSPVPPCWLVETRDFLPKPASFQSLFLEEWMSLLRSSSFLILHALVMQLNPTKVIWKHIISLCSFEQVCNEHTLKWVFIFLICTICKVRVVTPSLWNLSIHIILFFFFFFLITVESAWRKMIEGGKNHERMRPEWAAYQGGSYTVCWPVAACSWKGWKGTPVGKVLLGGSACPIYSQVIAVMLNKIVTAMTVSVSNTANQCW